MYHVNRTVDEQIAFLTNLRILERNMICLYCQTAMEKINCIHIKDKHVLSAYIQHTIETNVLAH